MPTRARGTRARLAGAVVAVLLAAVCLGVWRVLAGVQQLPYSDSATPPSAARVTEGSTYSLAVPGGVRAMTARGVPVTAGASGDVLDPSCTWVVGNSDVQALTVDAESLATKAVNTFAHFQAPVSGQLHITCSHWGTVFVPDSDDRRSDVSLWYLVLAAVFLSVGLPLGLASARSAAGGRSPRSAGDDDVPADVRADVPADVPADVRADVQGGAGTRREVGGGLA